MDLTLNTKAKKHFAEITDLIAKMPELERPGMAIQSEEWLGDVYELVKASGDLKDADNFKIQVDKLIDYANHSGGSGTSARYEPASKIQAIIQRARASLKSQASDLD